MFSKNFGDLRPVEPIPVWDEINFTILLGKTMCQNTPIFNWSDMSTLFQYLEDRNAEYYKSLFLNYLIDWFINERGPYSTLRGLLVLENIAEKYKDSTQSTGQSIIQMILDVLIDVFSTKTHENVRRKIQMLFHTWLYGNRTDLNAIFKFQKKLKLKKKGFQFCPKDKIEEKTTPLESCYKCGKSKPNIICAACIQLFCTECSMHVLALPHYGFQEEVRVCDVCFSSESEKDVNEGTSESETHDELPQPKEETANAAFIKSVECPICLDVIKKPVIICKSGHSMCQVCTIGKITICPVCRGEITSTRNYVLEDLLENQKANCIFTSGGCKEIVKLQEKEAHEAECKFRPIQCIGKEFCKWKCDWLGSSSKMAQHFTEMHKKNIISSQSRRRATIVVLNIRLISISPSYNIQLVNFCEGEKYFWCKYKVDNERKTFYCTVQLIGPKEEAPRYCYEISISNTLGRNFKIMEICENDDADAGKIFGSRRCFAVPFDTLKMYANEEGGVLCTLTIYDIAEDLL